MGAIASHITSLTIVYSNVYSDADQRNHQSSASLAFVRGIQRGPVNSPLKWPVTRKMFPLDDVISCDRCILTVTLPTLKRTHIGFQLSTLAKTCPNCEGTQHIIGSVRDCGSYDANAFFCWAIDIYIYIYILYIHIPLNLGPVSV